jgi:hypothetical protein
MRTTTSARAGATITNSSFMTSASTQTNNIYARIDRRGKESMHGAPTDWEEPTYISRI